MKRLVLISLLVVFSSYLFAQQQGDFVLSGSLSWTSQSAKQKFSNESEVAKGDRNFSFIPEFHYFVCDKLSVGLGIGYSLNKTPNDNENSDNDDVLFNKTGLFLMQPTARYYISLSEKFYYVPRFYIGFGVGKYKEELGDNQTSDINASTFNVGVSLLNFEFKPCDKIGIMFNAGDLEYQTVRMKFDSDNKLINREFGLGFNLGASVGFNFYF